MFIDYFIYKHALPVVLLSHTKIGTRCVTVSYYSKHRYLDQRKLKRACCIELYNCYGVMLYEGIEVPYCAIMLNVTWTCQAQAYSNIYTKSILLWEVQQSHTLNKTKKLLGVTVSNIITHLFGTD